MISKEKAGQSRADRRSDRKTETETEVISGDTETYLHAQRHTKQSEGAGQTVADGFGLCTLKG